MKSWQSILLGTFLGILAAVAMYLVAVPPRGSTIELLPAPTLPPDVVFIDGAVQKPGVYPLVQGSRVSDAVSAAGGLLENASTTSINLAAKVHDGEKIHIPPEDELQNGANPVLRSVEGPAESQPAGLININTANEADLTTLPGIGPARALDIIAYREQHGPFQNIEDLQDVPGIGTVTFDRLKDLITIY